MSATQLRTFLEDNKVDLAGLINNLVTTGDIVVKHLPGLRQVLILYPYVVEGGFTVVSKTPGGDYDAHFVMVLTNDPPVCHEGYQSTHTRPPQDGSNRPMNTAAHCSEPGSTSNPRGAQHAPSNRPAASYRTPVAALRTRAQEIAAASPLWDGEVFNLAVTDFRERVMEVRVLVSARNSGHAFDLRCELREKLIDYIQRTYPDGLPKVRAQGVETQSVNASVASNGATRVMQS